VTHAAFPHSSVRDSHLEKCSITMGKRVLLHKAPSLLLFAVSVSTVNPFSYELRLKAGVEN
jgi:hypothetical protein